MASRRKLKKILNAYMSDLQAQCVLLDLLLPADKSDQLEGIIIRLLNMDDDLMRRISHTEPGRAKAYYRQLRADLKTGLEALQADVEKLIDPKEGEA